MTRQPRQTLHSAHLYTNAIHHTFKKNAIPINLQMQPSLHDSYYREMCMVLTADCLGLVISIHDSRS